MKKQLSIIAGIMMLLSLGFAYDRVKNKKSTTTITVKEPTEIPKGNTVIDYANLWINDNELVPILEFMDDPEDMKRRIEEARREMDPNTHQCKIMIRSQAEYNTFMALMMGLTEEQYEMYFMQQQETNTQ